MIKFKNITVRNFMSVGNITQAINFQDAGLTLVLGNNLDLGGDGSRNGVGKTTMINALSYVLYGNAISSIKKNNLINKTNNKGMLVSVEFQANGTEYRIERGRSPNVLRFLVNNMNVVEDETDEGQGENRMTQTEIEKVIGMNHLMFKHLIALNTYNDPFLALRANDQREIIENLLGITLLSEKAAVLKEQNKTTKDQIKEEEYRIKGTEAANEQIKKSIDDLRRRAKVWKTQNTATIQELESSTAKLQAINIQDEIEQHIALEKYIQINSLLAEYAKAKTSFINEIGKESIILDKAQRDLELAENHKCFACGQGLHDTANLEIITAKKHDIDAATAAIQSATSAMNEIQDEIDSLVLPDNIPTTNYSSAAEAYAHQSKLTTVMSKLADVLVAEDPYTEQVDQLENNGLQLIDWAAMNELHKLREHQDFLLKLLINKDSYIRKRIIEQNMQYLNTRLNYYLNKLGLPHEVVFLSDLTVEITELGRELDFDNLSRGERTRLILGLSWAFRDVHESTNMPIDFMAIDELLDNGLDQNGVECALVVLKKMHRDLNKNIFLISHREELHSRIDNILYVIKENGFTSFSLEKEFDIEHQS
jgi:DNA repair exonuclease SbcCD ATPase subunit